jgi:hypothetical protein
MVFGIVEKNQRDPVRIFGEMLKTSPIGKFTTHVVTSAANSNSLKNSSYGKVVSCEGRFEWSPRS